MTKEKIEKWEVKKPWQGKVWIIFFILTFFLICRFLFLDKLHCSYYEPSINYFECFYLEISVIFSLIFNPFSLFFLFLTKGVFIFVSFLTIFYIILIITFLKRFKESIFIALSISFVRFSFFFYFLIEEYSDFEHSFSRFYTPLSFIFLFICLLFILYLEISCLKHPFYNQNKINK